MQDKILGELIFARILVGPVFALARRQEIFLRDHFPHISHILEGLHFGANTCRACIRTRANTGKTPGKLFMYWFRAGGNCYRLLFCLNSSGQQLSDSFYCWDQKYSDGALVVGF